MNYPLKDVAEFSLYAERKVGLEIRCPNCGAAFGAYFKNPIGDGDPPLYARVTWQRTGDTFETMSLHPSFMAVGHFHSWIKDGELVVDSPFLCKKETAA